MVIWESQVSQNAFHTKQQAAVATAAKLEPGVNFQNATVVVPQKSVLRYFGGEFSCLGFICVGLITGLSRLIKILPN